MPGAGLSGRCPAKAPSDMPASQPYWGKPAVRNDRGDRGDVGIIRSPVRASVLPDPKPAEKTEKFVAPASRKNSVAPVTELKVVGKELHDPNKGTASVVIDATKGAFRFSTGAQDKGDYKNKTPYGTLGVRG